MYTLPSNSTITVDGVTINSNASAILLWESVIRRAINAGDSKWIRLREEDGTRGILVHRGSTIASFIADADATVDGENFLSDVFRDWNLPAWVDEYIDPEDSVWGLVETLGIDKEIAAKKAMNEASDGPSPTTHAEATSA